MTERSGTEREYVCGRQPVYELLRAQRRDVHALARLKSVQPAGILARIEKMARARNIPIDEVDHRTLDRLARGINHQGVAVEVGPYPYEAFSDLLGADAGPGPGLLLALDHLQDPQNFGSILRSADAAGVRGVVIARDRQVAVTPTVVRTSAGASEHVRIAQVVNIGDALLAARKQGYWIAGLESGAEVDVYTRRDLTGPLILVVGSEGEGIGKRIRDLCDFLIRIPMCGRVESLNAAVATAVALFEIRRQRDAGAGS